MPQASNCTAIPTVSQCSSTPGCYGYLLGGRPVCKCSKFAYGPDDACVPCGKNEMQNTARTGCVCTDGKGVNPATGICEECTGNSYMDIAIAQKDNKTVPCLPCTARGRYAADVPITNHYGHNQCRCDKKNGFKDDWLSRNEDCDCQDGLVLSQDEKRCCNPKDTGCLDGTSTGGNNGNGNGNTGDNNGGNNNWNNNWNNNNNNNWNNDWDNDGTNNKADGSAASAPAILFACIIAAIVSIFLVATVYMVVRKYKKNQQANQNIEITTEQL